jgi:hypothetical protein
MTGGSPWAAPPETGRQQAPIYPPLPAAIPSQSGPPVAPPPRPPRHLPWLFIGGAVVLLIAVIAATAAVTYAVARNADAPKASPTTQAPTQFSEADQAAAKQSVCEVFDAATKGQQGQGGVRINGDANLPLMLRSLNSVVAVQNALTPATPREVVDAAHQYEDANLRLTTAATGTTPIAEVNRLNAVANTATFAFADACGLPH